MEAITRNEKTVYVTFCPDCEYNVGGYYCQIYTDKNCENEIDDLVVHADDLTGTIEEREQQAEEIALREISELTFNI